MTGRPTGRPGTRRDVAAAGSLADARVAAARAARYDAPESSSNEVGRAQGGEVGRALGRAAVALGWGDAESPFGGVIPAGARVVVKPNWVMHVNQGAGGMEPMITHASLVRAAVEAALRTPAAEVTVGDAPLQACDFPALLAEGGLGAWAAELQRREPRFLGVRDFRRTVATFVSGVRVASENVRPADRFALFDLAGESLLEPVTSGGGRFRVTCYDPRLMARTHAPRRHQYLVAREIVEADVVVNLPKLKTHMKAGLTCALKNLIGINGNKEYLPHHRRGGAAAGGDCYPGASPVKRALEYVLDRQNMAKSFAAGRAWRLAAEQLYRAARLTGDRLGIEGSWSGNDTIWRTCLDLNRVLLYGRADGTLSDEPQRRVLHVVDAVVAGQGNGPLAPLPLPLGLLLAGGNAAAVDRTAAHLLGYDPERVPIVRESFAWFTWPLARFDGRDVELTGDLGEGRADELLGAAAGARPRVSYPAGWRTAAARPREGADAGGGGAAALTEEMVEG